MCNFHSIVGRMLGDTAELLHASHNSHSQMISDSKWRENKPNEIVRVFEAEWDCSGKFPSDANLIRNVSECPEKLKDKIRNHYKKVQAAIKDGSHLDHYFSDFDKYADVFSLATTNGVPVKFPKHVKTDLYLSSLTSIPEGLKLPDTIGGSLCLRSLTSIPEGLKLPDTIGGSLYLSSMNAKQFNELKKHPKWGHKVTR